MTNLGSTAPFIAILSLGVLAACLVVIATRPLSTSDGRVSHSASRFKGIITFALAVVTFELWGSANGHGGPDANGGMLGSTQGGAFDYVSVLSHQPRADAPWSHDVSIRPLRLLATFGLNALALIVAMAGSRWIARRLPDRPVHGGLQAEPDIQLRDLGAASGSATERAE